MKTFVFKEMLLASFREKKARRIPFDPKVTIIRGNNETGKSSLIKSILRTFGAEPAKVHPNWVDADVRSLVRFDIDGTQYAILRHGNSYAVFDARAKLLNRFDSVTKGLAPFLAQLFNFGLRLPNREGESTPLPPAYYFLPFYMDQDASWTKSWSAFAHLEQFANWRRGVIEYHAGIRGNSFYETQAQKLDAETELNKIRRRREGLQEVYAGLSKRFAGAQFNVDFSAYREEVDELLKRCDALKVREEKFKAQISELWNRRQSLKTQLDITIHAREESKKDYEHASNIADENVQCPTCGAHYANAFAERFSIAVDEDRCASLALNLAEEVRGLDAEIGVEIDNSKKVAAELAEIERLLAKREGEVALRDLIQQEGRRELRDVMNHDIGILIREENGERAKIEAAEKRMKQLDSPARRKEVNEFYKQKMRSFLHALDIQSVQDKAIEKVDGIIRDTGSELPRALLASQIAFIHVIEKFGSAAFAPLVIDSPNQQDQDDKHLDRILRFIKDQRPANMQLVLGLVDAPGVDFGGTEIRLEKKYSLLLESAFADVGDEIQHFIDAALEK